MVIMEMDPEAPGFERLRSNAMLFSLIRSTEPFLDQVAASSQCTSGRMAVGSLWRAFYDYHH